MKNLLEYLEQNTLLNDCNEQYENPFITNDFKAMTLREFKSVVNAVFGTTMTVIDSDKSMPLFVTVNNDGQVVCLPSDTAKYRIVNTSVMGYTFREALGVENSTTRMQFGIIEKIVKGLPIELFHPDANTIRFIGFSVAVDEIGCEMTKNVFIANYIGTKTFTTNRYGEFEYSGIDKGHEAEVNAAIEKYKNENAFDSRSVVVCMNRSNDVIDFTLDKFNTLFKEAGLTNNDTFAKYIDTMFKKWCESKYPWMLENKQGIALLQDRFMSGKRILANDIRTIYPQREQEVYEIEKNEARDAVRFSTAKLYDTFVDFSTTVLQFLNDITENINIYADVQHLRSAMRMLIDSVALSATGIDNAITQAVNALGEFVVNVDARTIVFDDEGCLVKMQGLFSPVASFLTSKN